MKSISTPWGMSQTEEKICDGATEYTTASHGGIHVRADLWQKIKGAFPGFTPWAGLDGRGGAWLEEDCDTILFHAVFPEYCRHDAGKVRDFARRIYDGQFSACVDKLPALAAA